jgi:transcriptional regulator with XRE-family HTH domain
MPKTLRSPDHQLLIDVLRAARKRAGLTQQTLADKLERPQSFVAKYENGERRLDVIEFVTLARIFCVAPEKLLQRYIKALMAGADSKTKR